MTHRKTDFYTSGLEIVNDGVFLLRAYSGNTQVGNPGIARTKVSRTGNKARLELDGGVVLVIPANTTVDKLELYDPIREIVISNEYDEGVFFDVNSLYTVYSFYWEVG